MRFREHRIIAGQIINLTGSPFSMYEESSGKVLVLLPSIEKLPVRYYSHCLLPETFYVVSEEQLEKIRKTDRDLKDIAVIRDVGSGISGLNICSLVSADNRDIYIGLQRRCFVENHSLPYIDQTRLYVELT